MKQMTTNKPYLLRALYDWIVDNELTPYLVVDANYPALQIPREHVQEGRIILNISPKACRGLHLENDRIVFTTRFAGESLQIFLVPAAVLAIYAKENGAGMEFPPELEQADAAAVAKAQLSAKKPALTLVKKD